MTFEIALTGLRAASTELESISNHIANTSTVGFKSSEVSFGDIYGTAGIGGTGNSVGRGVRVTDVVQKFAKGDVTYAVSELTGVNHGNTLTGISLLADERMLMILGVEEIIAEVLGSGIDTIEATPMTQHNKDVMIFFADDSRVARKQVGRILEKMGINYHTAKNGHEAYEILDQLAHDAESVGQPLCESLKAVITDVEMPVMDGYMLARKIKEDKRFDGIPVMMHSSLSTEENMRLGRKLGVDAYIPKLRPKEFSETLSQLINPPREKVT